MCLRYGYWCICEWVCIRVHQLRKLLNNPQKDTFLLQQGWRVYSIYVLHLLTFATRKALPISTCKRIGKHLKTSRDIGPKPKKHIKTHDWIKIGQECSCPKLFFDNFPLPAHRTVMIHWLCQSIWTIAKCCARPSARASARYPWFRLEKLSLKFDCAMNEDWSFQEQPSPVSDIPPFKHEKITGPYTGEILCP